MSKSTKLGLAIPILFGFFTLACFGQRSENASLQGSGTRETAALDPSPALAGDAQLLRARVAGLEADLHAIQTNAALPAMRTSTVTPQVTPQIVDANPDLVRRVADAATLQARYDAALASENLDQRWGPAQEGTLVAFFATDAAKGARLEKVECRESMCRLRVHFDDRNARSHFMTNIGSPPFDHGGFYRTDEATGTFSLYTAREGRTLPSVDSGPT